MNRARRELGRWLFLGVLALVGSGCFGAGLEALRQNPLGDRVGAQERARVESLLAERRGDVSSRASLRGYARVRIQGELGKARVREVIAAERPARLRVETLNFLGQAQSVLVANGARSTLYEGSQVVESAYPGELLMRLGLDLTPSEAIDLLLATPAIPAEAPGGVWASGDERIVEYAERRLRLDAAGEIRGVEALEGDGSPRWIVEFDRWSDVEGGRYPLEIRAYFPLTDLRAEFVFEEVELNTELQDALFRLEASRE